ncbi:MAG: MFS transporter [Gordonia sp.]|uniref:MFS transporter n=1 Tax=Gordonia sp. (in: high G+C Gram-positive bacteria) TaxID=84139 RepID=UPI001D92309B|nr:MFS transporter [Gordonia sp. (in: high G+C Gram-positive bacteria)]
MSKSDEALSTSTPGSTAPGTGRWIPVSLAVFASAWGGNEFTPLLVMYRQDGSLSDVAVDGLLFTYVLGIVPALLIGGPLSDRLGRRPLMFPAPVFAALGSVLLALGSQSLTLMSLGRVFSGVALGLSMAVGGSWIAEISRREGAANRAATRAAMSLTAGFGLGAGLAAVLAQWAPWPHVLAYAVNIALSVIALALLPRAPETRPRNRSAGSLVDDLPITGLAHPRFLFIVLPVAPWVFGACATAYAIIPSLMTDKTSSAPIAFAGLCCLLGLGVGFGIQVVGRHIARPGTVRGAVLALVLVAAGMGLSVLTARTLSIWVALVAAAVLGCGYGMAVLSGLLEVQQLATPDNLAGLTAVFYSATYLGFAMPMLLAFISETWPSVTYPMMFGVGVGAALTSLVVVVAAHRLNPVHVRVTDVRAVAE